MSVLLGCYLLLAVAFYAAAAADFVHRPFGCASVPAAAVTAACKPSRLNCEDLEQSDSGSNIASTSCYLFPATVLDACCC